MWFQFFTAVRQYHTSELQRLQNNFLYYLCMIFHQLPRTCHHVQRLTSVATSHVFVVDIILFIKRFVVFSTLNFWHEFLLCVASWVMVGAMLGDGWCNVGSWVA